MANPFGFYRFLQKNGNFTLMDLIHFIVHIPNFVKLFTRLLQDKRVPFYLKALCYGAIFYFFFPIDFIRDRAFFGLGYIDDITFLYLSFSNLVKASPPEVVREHVEAISKGLPS